MTKIERVLDPYTKDAKQNPIPQITQGDVKRAMSQMNPNRGISTLSVLMKRKLSSVKPTTIRVEFKNFLFLIRRLLHLFLKKNKIYQI